MAVKKKVLFPDRVSVLTEIAAGQAKVLTVDLYTFGRFVLAYVLPSVGEAKWTVKTAAVAGTVGYDVMMWTMDSLNRTDLSNITLEDPYTLREYKQIVSASRAAV